MSWLALFAAVGLVYGVVFWRWRLKYYDAVIHEWIRKFPGRCLVCSLHQYGYYFGHEKFPLPPEHDCIEVER
jgi:hypothetical protein